MSTSAHLPRHIAIVMDGNGRWAKKRLLPRTAGHHAGVRTAKTIIETCARKKIEVLSLFTFSSENWLRPESEISYLQKLMLNALTQYLVELHQHSIQLLFIGDLSRFPQDLQAEMSRAQTLTQYNHGMKLLIAVNYGGRWDITHAMQNIVREIQNGNIQVSDINEKLIKQHLVTQDLPYPDLFIRTSGEQRISNFFIWQLAYTELFFTDVLWPDFSETELNRAIDFYQSRERRYGCTSEQLKNQGKN